MSDPMIVTIRDCTLRDGLQHEEHYISLEDRAALLQMLIEAGIRNLEIGSISHPAYIPQFREIDRFLLEVVPELSYPDDVEFTVLALNKKAVDRVIGLADKGARIDRVLTGQIATSEAYALKNMNRSRETLLSEAGENVTRLHAAGIKRVCANVGTIFGCPIQNTSSLDTAYEYVDRLFQMGFDEIEHSDPTGAANPNKVHEYFSVIFDRWSDPGRHIFHVHDIRGGGIANYFAAIREGVTQFDCSLGGTGGQPANQMDGVSVKGTGEYYFEEGHTGLVCTEDFGALLIDSGMSKGVDLKRMLHAGIAAERILGRTLNSVIIDASRTRLNNAEK